MSNMTVCIFESGFVGQYCSGDDEKRFTAKEGDHCIEDHPTALTHSISLCLCVDVDFPK
jgi:hypothetical protein